MLVDNITLTIKAGDGGNGSASFLRNGQTSKGGPDGGNGGNGGNIYFEGSTNINDLREFRFKKKISAAEGIAGRGKNLFGKNAPHTTIKVPIGTRITDLASNTTFEITKPAVPVLFAQGGKGGRGNNEFKSSINQTPLYAEKGTQGEEKKLLLELRLIADVGLIGLPNAGKSSLLATLTHATPKIGNYPFTTLEPNVGMMGNYTIADIPGLIEGASTGKGLGVTFLKHIEKTKLLVHCIDSTDKNILQTYETVRKEFREYNSKLLEKHEVIVLTKIDLTDKETLEKNTELFKDKNPLLCSIYDEESVEKLKKVLINLLVKEQ